MLSTLNLFIQDLQHYSQDNLSIMAEYLNLPVSDKKNYLINSIAMEQTLNHFRSANMELEEFPPELITKILQDLDLKSILHLCQTSKQFLQYCDANSYIWKALYEKYLSEINLPKEKDYKKRIIEIEKMPDTIVKIEKSYFGSKPIVIVYINIEKYLYASKNGYDKYIDHVPIEKLKNIITILLVDAARLGHEYLVDKFIKLGATNFDAGMSAAAEGGHEHLVNKFIKLGATNFNWGMVSAAKGGYEKLVDKFIKLGAIDFDWGMVSAVKEGNEHLIDKFIKLGATNFDDGMFSAAGGGNENLVDKFIKLGATNFFDVLMETIRSANRSNNVKRKRELEQIIYKLMKKLSRANLKKHINMLKEIADNNELRKKIQQWYDEIKRNF